LAEAPVAVLALVGQQVAVDIDIEAAGGA